MTVMLLQFDMCVYALWPLTLGIGLLFGKHVIPLLMKHDVVSGIKRGGLESVNLGLITGFITLHVSMKELGLLPFMTRISKGRITLWIKIFIILVGHFHEVTSETVQERGHFNDSYARLKLHHEGWYDITNIESTFLFRELYTVYGLFWLATLCFMQISCLSWLLCSSSKRCLYVLKVCKTNSKQCPDTPTSSDGKFYMCK
jgi:hypothetical protein